MNMILDENSNIGIVNDSWFMIQDGDTTVFKAMVCQKLTNTSMDGYVEFVFSGNQITKLTNYIHWFDFTTGAMLSDNKIIYNFTHNIENFTVDTSGYTEAPSA